MKHHLSRLAILALGSGLLLAELPALLPSAGLQPQDAATTQVRVPPLTAPEKEILAGIRPQDVRGILSFLACDELRGRDTPSPELNIAAAYVASRFRAAGLEGIGPKGSYYLEHELSARQLPSLGVVALDGKGNPIPNYGLVSANARPYEWNGPLAPSTTESAKGGPILLDAPANLRGRMARMPAGFLVIQASSKARGQKANAVLLRVPQDHPLVGLSAMARSRPVSQRTLAPSFRRRADPLPILLIPEGTEVEGPVRLYFPPFVDSKVKVRNVGAVLRGRDPEAAKKAVLFTGHLDHIGTSAPQNGDSVFNGADDDATGCTAVMLLARAYAALPQAPRHSTIFMTWWGEEKGLLGSKQFASDPAWPLEDILCNINIEMIGRPPAEGRAASWVTGWSKSDLGPLMALGAERADIRIYEHPQLSARLYGSSDNWSLAQKGVIAHSFSASSLHKDYHGLGDEWTKIDASNMARVIQGLFAGSLPIAEGLLTPGKN